MTSKSPFRCVWVCCLLLWIVVDRSWAAADLVVEVYSDNLTVRRRDGPVLLRYQTSAPVDSKLSVASAGYFHPLITPLGEVVTDVAPDDHRHHRGIFLAWVEMHGAVDADFWGWGEPAPKEGRVIVNRGARGAVTPAGSARLEFHNDWMAGDRRLLREDLTAEFRVSRREHVLDLTYRLTPDSDLRLARWAFSGFCVRTRKDTRAEIWSPQGPVRLPAPRHTEPASDWPDASWYAFRHQLAEGGLCGVAVTAHPANPSALWHNHPEVRMLNPCITAPGEVRIAVGAPLVLRYRVTAWDGDVPVARLDRSARDFARSSHAPSGAR